MGSSHVAPQEKYDNGRPADIQHREREAVADRSHRRRTVHANGVWRLSSPVVLDLRRDRPAHAQ